MADIFVSYARESEPQARLVVGELVRAGYEVWWDQDLLPHTTFSEVTEARLRAAKAVLVLWSEPGVGSQWVRAEADVGRTAHTLVQARLDGAEPPLPFNQVQATSLADWTGDPQHPGWRKVMASVAHLTGKAPRATAETAVAPPQRPRRGMTWVLAAMSVLVVALGLAAGGWWMLRSWPPADGAPLFVMRAFESPADTSGLAAQLADRIEGVLTANVQGLAIGRAPATGAPRADMAIGGSVRREGDRWRVRAEIVDTRSGIALWTRQFDRPATRQDALAEEVAASIADAVGSVMDASQQAGVRLDPQTLALYLKASEAMKSASPDQPGLARQLIERVLAHEPRLAVAHATTAFILSLEGRRATPAEAEAQRLRAWAEARRAIQLDPSAGSGAYDALFFQTRREAPMDLAKAEAWLLEGLRTNSNFFSVPMRECQFLAEVGRVRDALPYCERAAGIRPLAAPPTHFHANALHAAGSVEMASRAIERAARRHPDHTSIRRTRFDIAAFSGDPDQARKLLKDPDTAPLMAASVAAGLDAFLQARTSGAAADADRAIGMLRRAAEAGASDHRYAFLAAAALGRVDEAFEIARGRPCALLTSPQPGCLFGPQTAALRRDRRFMTLAAPLGLTRYWRESNQWPDFCAEPSLPYDCRTEAARAEAAG